MRNTFAALVMFAGLVAGQIVDPRAAFESGCDRACLTGVLGQYLNAMAANDSSKAPFAANAKYTENTARLPLNQGLWFTAAGLTNYKIALADPQGSSAGFIGVVTEHMPPGQASLATRFWRCGSRWRIARLARRKRWWCAA